MRLAQMVRTLTAMIGPARPIILYHKPTARCDCRCKFCDSWAHQPDGDDVLPSRRILALLDQAHAAGMTTYTVWGGEPLLAENLPDWLRHARGLGMETVVCTSGYKLAERASEIGPNIDRLLLSLEAVGDRQDKIRKTAGLFERVISGIGAFRKHGGGEITIWSNLTRENRDQVEEIARFARDQGVWVEFFPAALYPGYNDKIILDSNEREEVFDRVKEIKRQGYPVLNTGYALLLMRSGRPFKCNLARLAVQVFPDGTIYACEPRTIPDLSPYGTIDDIDLVSFASSKKYRRARLQLLSCNRCLLPCVANMADSLILQALRRTMGKLYYRLNLLST